ncbi:MAG: restriction endonuclease [bacterium]|nr:restriction endonuclease [bacterium]
MSSTREKGNILEDIVRLLHDLPDVKVETRVRLPSIRAGSTRKREIDVLLTSSVAGYPVRIAIECKNYRNKIKSEKIDGFVGKLADVGIPAVNGIYVTTTGYRSDALKLAKESGIRALVLEGLDRERIRLEVNAAMRSVVFYLAIWISLSRFDDLDPDVSINMPAPVVDFPEELGQGTPSIITLFALLWQRDEIPTAMGTHLLAIRMPQDFRFSKDEAPAARALVMLTYEVVAYVDAITGTSSAAVLRDAATQTVEKVRVDAQFGNVTRLGQLRRFESEEELRTFLGESRFNIVTKVKVPRVQSEWCFWPPSRRAAEEIMRRRQAGEEPKFEEIEGCKLNAAWEASIYEEGVEDPRGGAE